ncbi:hypothetical protein JOF53_004515 [Crossiella equi]|uniref:DUF304 domain-containing protein n=1 Tax=Crossiella equi TaxID=130796 RepID=A0ABS5AGC8_9PSEU|nr:hypothetical protein [Crossiella equi]MBP2475643.1 hypothetical protein [Crossiella equi]
MQPDPQPVVADPVTDRPAARDPHTAAAVAQLQQVIYLLPVVTAGLLVLVYLGWLSLVTGLVGAAVLLALFGLYLPRLLATRKLVSAHTWRPVAATVLGSGGLKFTADADGRTFAITEVLGRFGHRVVARTGRLWLLGPLPSGHVLVRVDGVTAALPGKSVATPSRLGPVAQDAPGPAGTAAEDGLVRAWARQCVRQARLRIWVGPLVYVLLAPPLLTFVVPPWQDVRALVIFLFGLVVGLVFALVRTGVLHRRFAHYVRLPELLAAGPWQQALVTIGPWQGKGLGLGDADGMLHVPTANVPVHLPQAGRDLVANIQATGRVWFVGELRPGAVLALGYPGFPVLGVAVCGPA